MSRLVLHERDHPYVVKVGEETLHLCACGLSKNKPYCDGSHTKTMKEGSDVFMYDKEGKAIKIESFYPK